VAAILAGSTMDMLRTSVLYPVLTLKNRIQKDIKTHKFPPTIDNLLHLKRRLKVMQLNAQRHFEEGELYRGIVPSLLKSAPATGVYYGTRDVMKRALHSSLLPHLSTVQVSIIAALVADIFSLMVKTPADTLATRLQVAKVPTKAEIGAGPGDEEAVEEAIQAEVDAQVGNWFTESLERLPAIILTDLPYLLSRIAINQSLLNGNSIDIGRYEIMAITTALLCAFLTTPFDVARTRILIDSDNDPTNGIDGGSGEGLVHAFEKIMSEGDGGVRNLFAGWLERTLYLGVGRAWIEPFQMVGYAILRDMILLEWFD
jgi:Mitochondrial carrier protein